MALTNPSSIITVGDLDYYRQKSDLRYCARDSIYRLASEADVRGFVQQYVIVVE